MWKLMYLYIILFSLSYQFVLCLSYYDYQYEYEQWGNQIPDNCINISTLVCSKVKYRTMDGSCNNFRNPTLGMPLTSFRRLLPPNYGDKISSMPLSKSGNPLPSARLLSLAMSGHETIPDPNFTLLNMQWGQLVAHDTALRLPATHPSLKVQEAKSQNCCSRRGRFEKRSTKSKCFPVPVPKNDPFLKNVECINFDRSVTDKDQQCRGTSDPIPAEQLNGVTHYMDMSFLYGNNKEMSRYLREYHKGLLRTDHGKSKWPPRTLIPMLSCGMVSPGGLCYEFGDVRGNQNLGLATLQIVFLREHNRIAKELSKVNKCWDDETLFQEARRINIAQFQYITFYEWLGNSYGTDRLLKNELIFNMKSDEYTNDYDPYVDPRGIQAFSHAAFRYFHSQIVGHFELFNEQRQYTNESYRLMDYENNPSPLQGGCKYSSLVRGLATQPADSTDNHFNVEIAANFMLPGTIGNQGLRMVDIQRSRDHGLPSYNQYRALCGLKRAKNWLDYSDYISHEDIDKLKNIYESHEDVDLAIGGALERKEPESLAGPTFQCISLIQFKNYRTGDRYFFENGMQPYPFRKEQLAEIRKASVARILCDNANVELMQSKAFLRISKSNPLKLCSELPKIDLSKWYDEKPCETHDLKGFFNSIYRNIKDRFEKQ